MITIADLNSAVAAADRRTNLNYAAAFSWIPICGGAAWLIRSPARALILQWFDPIVTEYVLIGALGLAMGLPAMTSLVVGSRITESRDRQDWRLVCPSCGTPLQGMQSLVIATRNCGHCGKRVLAEPNGPDLA